MDNASFTQGGRLYEVLSRAYRVRTYRPARYYLTWYFMGSLVATFLPVWDTYLLWRAGGLEQAIAGLWYNVPGFLVGLFLVLLSTFYAMIGSSTHLVLGDKGIYSLGKFQATAPVVTKSVFLITSPEQKSLYEEKYWGGRVTRHMVWRWGPKGGCENWPGKAGGKSEGFYASVVYAWDEVDYLVHDAATKKETTVHEVIEWQPCPTCNPARKSPKPGLIHVPPLDAAGVAELATQYPGIKRGGVVDVRRQILPDRFLEELPYQVADAIFHHEEYRASSRVDVGLDPLPDGGGLGTLLTHNAEIRLFGLEYASKLSNMKVVNLQQILSVVSQLEGGRLGGPGIGPSSPPK